MGANDKHAATYHGGEYTPTTEDVAYWYEGEHEPQQRRAEFDRWLEQVRAEAKAEAYKDAADVLHAEARWQTDLKQRHEEYRFKHCANRMTEMENVMTTRANQYEGEQ